MFLDGKRIVSSDHALDWPARPDRVRDGQGDDGRDEDDPEDVELEEIDVQDGALHGVRLHLARRPLGDDAALVLDHANDASRAMLAGAPQPCRRTLQRRRWLADGDGSGPSGMNVALERVEAGGVVLILADEPEGSELDLDEGVAGVGVVARGAREQVPGLNERVLARTPAGRWGRRRRRGSRCRAGCPGSRG